MFYQEVYKQVCRPSWEQSGRHKTNRMKLFT